MASRKEEKERRRQERLERQERERESTEQRKQIGLAVLGVVVVAAIVVGVVLLVGKSGGGGGGKGPSSALVKFTEEGIKPPPVKTKSLEQAAKQARCELISHESEGRNHLSPGQKPPKYKTNPPTSGDHNPVALEDGAYKELPDSEKTKTIHSLEHGRVEIQFRGIGESQQRQLKGLFDEDSYHVILMPNLSKMPYRLAAVAWTKLLGCKKMTDTSFDAIRAFKAKYVDQGPELIP